MTLKIQVSANFPAVILAPSVITITTTPAVLPPTASEVLFNVAGAASTTLPDAVTWATRNPGVDLLLKDISGNAFANNITINRAGLNMIDGLTSIIISLNYGAYSLRVTPSGQWMVVG